MGPNESPHLDFRPDFDRRFVHWHSWEYVVMPVREFSCKPLVYVVGAPHWLHDPYKRGGMGMIQLDQYMHLVNIDLQNTGHVDLIWFTTFIQTFRRPCSPKNDVFLAFYGLDGWGLQGQKSGKNKPGLFQTMPFPEWHPPFSSFSSFSGVWGAKPLFSAGRMQIRHFRRFRQNGPFLAGDKSTVHQKHGLRDPEKNSHDVQFEEYHAPTRQEISKVPTLANTEVVTEQFFGTSGKLFHARSERAATRGHWKDQFPASVSHWAIHWCFWHHIWT